jgi:hypothetical protein
MKRIILMQKVITQPSVKNCLLLHCWVSPTRSRTSPLSWMNIHVGSGQSLLTCVKVDEMKFIVQHRNLKISHSDAYYLPPLGSLVRTSFSAIWGIGFVFSCISTGAARSHHPSKESYQISAHKVHKSKKRKGPHWPGASDTNRKDNCIIILPEQNYRSSFVFNVWCYFCSRVRDNFAAIEGASYFDAVVPQVVITINVATLRHKQRRLRAMHASTLFKNAAFSVLLISRRHVIGFYNVEIHKLL